MRWIFFLYKLDVEGLLQIENMLQAREGRVESFKKLTVLDPIFHTFQFLTRPQNSNKNFPFHVRTSQVCLDCFFIILCFLYSLYFSLYSQSSLYFLFTCLLIFYLIMCSIYTVFCLCSSTHVAAKNKQG